MAGQPALVTADVPSKDERTMAFLAHLLQVLTGFIAPLIIFCVKQDSRFVKFHALQALIWQLCYMAAFACGMVVFFVMFFLSMAHGAATSGHNQPPPLGFFILFPLVWLLGMAGWVVNVILGIVYGVKASRGEWAGYPILGPLLLRKYHPAAQTFSARSMS